MLRWIAARLGAGRDRRFRDESGAVAPLMALMIIPIAGATAMAVELGEWYYFQRAMQNAADSAALAAATNANSTGTGSTYLFEARAAARGFGFVDGQDSTTVTARPPAEVTCPTGLPAGSLCYEARLTKVLPIAFSALVGFRGDANGGFAQTITATAVATVSGANSSKAACVWSLSNDPDSFMSYGGPKPDLSGCSIVSNGGATCTGHDLGADYGIAVGDVSGCGKKEIEGATAPVDNYAPLASKIPTNSCSSYPVKPVNTNGNNPDPALPASNLLAGSMNISSPKCGDVQLTGDVTLTGDNTITIFNGTLDLNGHTLRTDSGASATVIFSGTNAASAVRAPTGSGTLDIAAPKSGPWSGVAMYQDPGMSPPSSSLDLTYSGNQPTWNISGLVYLPKSNVTFSGIVNKSGNGTGCFVIVAYTILVNGTGTIFGDNTHCGDYNFTPPTVGTATREKLVR